MGNLFAYATAVLLVAYGCASFAFVFSPAPESEEDNQFRTFFAVFAFFQFALATGLVVTHV